METTKKYLTRHFLTQHKDIHKIQCGLYCFVDQSLRKRVITKANLQEGSLVIFMITGKTRRKVYINHNQCTKPGSTPSIHGRKTHSTNKSKGRSFCVLYNTSFILSSKLTTGA